MKRLWSTVVSLSMALALLLSACSAPTEDTPSTKPDSPETSEAIQSAEVVQSEKPVFDDGKPYKTVKFDCTNSGKKINGTMYSPKNADGPFPTVIISHGFNNTMMNVQSFALELANNGYVSVIFDFCGGGKSSTSDGETTEMSVFTEKADLETVFEYVKALEETDNEQMFLLGASQGGLVSAMVAADLGSEVKALALLYPALCAADDAREQYPSSEEIPETVDYMGLTVGKIYFDSMLDYDPFEDVTRYTEDVLIIHGTADTTVPYEYSVKAVREFANAELITYEDAGHGFNGKDAQQSLEDVTAFFNARTAK